MAHAEHSVTIDRPAADIFDFVADGANNPVWRPSVIDVEKVGAGSGAGAEWKQSMKGPGGRRVAGDYRFTTFERPSRLAFEVTAGPARPTGEYRFEPAGIATRVTFVLDLQPRGFMKLMAPMINKQVKQEVGHLDNLKAVMER